MQQRIEYFDVLRGLAIIGVVAIHSSGGGLSFPSDSFNFNFTLMWRQILNVSVPLFLAISGYFLVKNIDNSPKEHFNFLKKQIPRVYIPTMFWSLISLTIVFFLLDKPLVVEIKKLLTFQAVEAYYFIALIIQYYLLLPLFKSFLNIRGILISVFISFLMIIIIFYMRVYSDIDLPLIIYGGLFPTWMIFFVYGLYLGSGKEVKMSNKWLIVGILVFYVLSCMESYFLYLQFNQAANAVTAVKITSFIYSLFVISFLFKNINFINFKLMKQLGDMSFGIYLIHVFIMPITSKILKIFPILYNLQPIYQTIWLLSTLVIAYFVIVLSQQIFNKRLLKILGF